MKKGLMFNSIQVAENSIIVDGHHRYICHKLLDLIPETTDGGANSHQVEFVWGVVNLTIDDYDDEDARIRFAERYDK